MSLRSYKFIIQAVVQEVDSGGAVIDEKMTDPVTVFGSDVLEEWAKGFPDALKALEEQE